MRIEPASGGSNTPERPIKKSDCGKIVNLAHYLMEQMPTPHEGFGHDVKPGGMNSAADARTKSLIRKTG